MVRSKKAQVSLGEAPGIVMIVGLIFLLLATFAYVNLKAGDSFATETTTTWTNDTTATPVQPNTWSYFSVAGYRNVVCGDVSLVNNATGGGGITSANYTQSGCAIKGTAALQLTPEYNNSKWKVTYSYTYDLPGVATNITDDSSTEIKANTSIAGIVLTISLVGIVLSVLIGIFLAARRGGM